MMLGRFLSSPHLVALMALGTGAIAMLQAAESAPQPYDASKTYAQAGVKVVYYEQQSSGGYRVGIFQNGWYVGPGSMPKFYPNDEGWVQVGETVEVTGLNEALGQTVPAPAWNALAAYGAGSIVKTSAGNCYRAKWWTKEDPSSGGPWEPSSCPSSQQATNPWVSKTVPSSGNAAPAPSTSAGSIAIAPSAPASNPTSSGSSSTQLTWDAAGIYLAGSVIQYKGICYKAQWWTQGNQPKPRNELQNAWDSPWAQLTTCPTGASLPANSIASTEKTSSADSDLAARSAAQPPLPQQTTLAAQKQTSSSNSPAIPPVIVTELPASTPVTTSAPVSLPDEGYAFLRLVKSDDWDWLFPLRSGKFAPNGGTRNGSPIANPNGTTDSFSLNAFIRAVLEYNNWAKANGYKQFLNEGTLKQQAEEFLVFWAKSSRETSGSWSTATSPWIVNQTFTNGETMNVWKGGLYWVEEVGFTTDSSTGKSAAIGYVDAGSSAFPPSDGRSYYGRGVIQLSWNYNYGAFSHWMYDNGLFKTAKDSTGKCLIDKRNKLLDYPNLVADCGDLSILSGIWFWMTPQGAKPSSHDVLFGDVINTSTSTQDMGLPQSNNGYIPKVAKGQTNDPEVFAWRLGTIINIVNGGLECNKASKWHNGPPQRVSYYNAYAAYFNEKHKVEATRIKEATDVWNTPVSDTSVANLQSATCYNQKSYYGW